MQYLVMRFFKNLKSILKSSYKCDICEKVVFTTEKTLKTHLKNLFFSNYKNFSYQTFIIRIVICIIFIISNPLYFGTGLAHVDTLQGQDMATIVAMKRRKEDKNDSQNSFQASSVPLNAIRAQQYMYVAPISQRVRSYSVVLSVGGNIFSPATFFKLGCISGGQPNNPILLLYRTLDIAIQAVWNFIQGEDRKNSTCIVRNKSGLLLFVDSSVMNF